MLQIGGGIMDIVIWTEPSKKFRCCSRMWPEYFTIAFIDDSRTNVIDRKASLIKKDTFKDCAVKSYTDIAQEIMKYPGARIYIDTEIGWCALIAAIESMGEPFSIDSAYVMNLFNHNTIFAKAIAKNITSRRRRLDKSIEAYKKHFYTPINIMYSFKDSRATLQDYTTLGPDDTPIITFLHENDDTLTKPDSRYSAPVMTATEVNYDDSHKIVESDKEYNEVITDDYDSEGSDSVSLDVSDDATEKSEDTKSLEVEEPVETIEESKKHEPVVLKSFELALDKTTITKGENLDELLVANKNNLTLHKRTCDKFKTIRTRYREYFNLEDIVRLKELGELDCSCSCLDNIDEILAAKAEAAKAEPENAVDTIETPADSTKESEITEVIDNNSTEISVETKADENNAKVNTEVTKTVYKDTVIDGGITDEDVDALDLSLPDIAYYIPIDDDEGTGPDAEVTLKEPVSIKTIDTGINVGVLAMQIIKLCNKFDLYCTTKDDEAKIVTAAGAWKFNYKERPITLYHQNSKTAYGGLKNSEYHIQGNDFYSPLDIIGYIVKHDNYKIVSAIEMARDKYKFI